MEQGKSDQIPQAMVLIGISCFLLVIVCLICAGVVCLFWALAGYMVANFINDVAGYVVFDTAISAKVWAGAAFGWILKDYSEVRSDD